jgi:hypothetical protein
MIAIKNTLISDDLVAVKFCCNLPVCLGACCVEGDAGAPLDEEEIAMIDDYINEIKPYMLPEGIEVVENLGVFDYDIEGNLVTPLFNDRECVFVYFEEGITRCAIEKAHTEGKIPFPKPISCHLYPVRLTPYKTFEAVNYHQWHICRPALEKGKEVEIPLYVFLKDALIRKYGKEWYEELDTEINERQKPVTALKKKK